MVEYPDADGACVAKEFAPSIVVDGDFFLPVAEDVAEGFTGV